MMVWALELVAFICVAATVRFLNQHKKLLGSVFHNCLNFLETGNKMFFYSFNINTQELVFSDFKASSDSLSWWDGQILNFFIVNLKHRSIYFVLHIFAFVGSDSGKNFIQCNRNDTLVSPVTDHTV